MPTAFYKRQGDANGTWVRVENVTLPGNVILLPESGVTYDLVNAADLISQITVSATGTAPTLTASDSLVSRTLTVSVTGSTGDPVPTFSIQMTDDGQEVIPTGSGPWTYVVPSSTMQTLIEWTVTAANGVIPNAAVSGSETIASDLTPASATNDTASWTQGVAITPYDITQNFTLNGNSGSFSVNLSAVAGLSVTGQTITGTPMGSGTFAIPIQFIDTHGYVTTSTLTATIGAAVNTTFSNVVWNEAAGTLNFDCTVAGTYTWHFGANSGTFAIVSGANNLSIDLNAYAGTTQVFRITQGAQELYVDANFTIPGSGATLSAPAGATTGTSTASGSVVSNNTTGTLYAGVWPTASAPSGAEIVAGTGATYHTTDITPTAGTNNFSATGLTENTAYKWHFYQVNPDGPSNIVTSAEFTTDAAVGLVEPVLLDTVVSGTNTTTDPFTADYPSYNVGDLIVVYVGNDNSDASIGPFVVTAPDGEAVYTEQAILGDDTNTSNEQTMAIFSYVAGVTKGSPGAGIGVDIAFGDQHVVMVQRYQAGTFKDTTPRMGSITRTANIAGGAAMLSAAISAAQEKSKVFFVANLSFNPPNDPIPSGWTQHVNSDVGALVGFLCTRDAVTTAGENVAAAQFESSTSNNWIGLTGLILPNGA